MNVSKAPILSLEKITRSFTQGEEKIDILRGVDLSIQAGEIIALIGPSGSGKSTLLQAAGLLEGGFGGRLHILGEDMTYAGQGQRTIMRRNHIGFVYQFHHLLPDFNALENVTLPQIIDGKSMKAAKERAMILLSRLGLGERLTHRPSQLSGGEQQRVAVARALANDPALILADEPTGNLDEGTSQVVLAEFIAIVRSEGAAALIATHNEKLAGSMDRILTLHEGRIYEKNNRQSERISSGMSNMLHSNSHQNRKGAGEVTDFSKNIFGDMGNDIGTRRMAVKSQAKKETVRYIGEDMKADKKE